MSQSHENISKKKLFILGSIYPSKFNSEIEALNFIEKVWNTHRSIHPFNDVLTSKKYSVWLCNEILNLGKRDIDENLNREIHSILLWATSTSPNITQISFSEAFERANNWRKKKILPPMVDLNRIISFNDDGYFLYDLIAEDLKYEGQLMGHCVGGYKKSYNFKSNILVSLRDAFNKPHVTFEATSDKSGNAPFSIIQQFGNGNKPVSFKHMNIIIQLISKHFKA